MKEIRGICANLQAAIKKSGRTKKWIAEKMGISYTNLWRQLTGRYTLKADTVLQISRLTGTTPNELYGIYSYS